MILLQFLFDSNSSSNSTEFAKNWKVHKNNHDSFIIGFDTALKWRRVGEGRVGTRGGLLKVDVGATFDGTYATRTRFFSVSNLRSIAAEWETRNPSLYFLSGAPWWVTWCLRRYHLFFTFFWQISQCISRPTVCMFRMCYEKINIFNKTFLRNYKMG